ncbi:MAG TPA: M18 family aminopeptidase [Ilumatobacteraceae bacterium]|nr:M18 family aminopeptidase [Ilumatobacteraceae bacterium]
MQLDDLIAFLAASPSPWHVVTTAADRLKASGFEAVDLTQAWTEAPDQGFVVRGAALVAWRRGSAADHTSPLRVVGAHTDSPGLRIKPRPDTGAVGWKQLGVEVYGGALINSWLDRDLGIAGRLELTDGTAINVRVDEAICRVPQLAIHLDRDVNERGLILDKQQHLIPVWGSGSPRAGEFAQWLADRVGVAAAAIAAWELCLFDRTQPEVLGADRSLLAAGRLDNQVSCWAAVEAMAASTNPQRSTAVIALFDHEEVGSESATGAAGPLLEHVLERLGQASGGSRPDFLAQLASSTCVSADNAHAVHPNYRERHEPEHQPIVNCGPAIKLNSNQRYATSARSAAMLQRVFEEAGVPSQVFVSRNNMPCGTTIGPITATRLGIETVDVGVPQLSMHSARELCGVEDPIWLAKGLRHFFDR